jgi:biotin carboxylase
VAPQALLLGPEARRFVAEVGYPIVLKPPAGLGSRGTMRVVDDESLRGGAGRVVRVAEQPGAGGVSS